MQHQLLLALHQLKTDETIKKAPRNSGYYSEANFKTFYELPPELIIEFNALLLLDHVHLLYEKNNKIFHSLGIYFKGDATNSVIAFLKAPNPLNLQNLIAVAEQLDSQYREAQGSLTTLFAESVMTCLSVVGLLFECLLGIVGIPLEGFATLIVYPRNSADISPVLSYSSWLMDSVDDMLKHADAVEDAFNDLTYHKARKTTDKLFEFFQEQAKENSTQDTELLTFSDH